MSRIYERLLHPLSLSIDSVIPEKVPRIRIRSLRIHVPAYLNCLSAMILTSLTKSTPAYFPVLQIPPVSSCTGRDDSDRVELIRESCHVLAVPRHVILGAASATSTLMDFMS